MLNHCPEWYKWVLTNLDNDRQWVCDTITTLLCLVSFVLSFITHHFLNSMLVRGGCYQNCLHSWQRIEARQIVAYWQAVNHHQTRHSYQPARLQPSTWINSHKASQNVGICRNGMLDYYVYLTLKGCKCSSENIGTLLYTVQECVERLQYWFWNNGLLLSQN